MLHDRVGPVPRLMYATRDFVVSLDLNVRYISLSKNRCDGGFTRNERPVSGVGHSDSHANRTRRAIPVRVPVRQNVRVFVVWEPVLNRQGAGFRSSWGV